MFSLQLLSSSGLTKAEHMAATGGLGQYTLLDMLENASGGTPLVGVAASHPPVAACCCASCAGQGNSQSDIVEGHFGHYHQVKQDGDMTITAHGLVMPGSAEGYVKSLFGTDEALWSEGGFGSAAFGNAITLTYTFGNVSWANPFGHPSQQFMDASQQTASTAAMQMWADVANITFSVDNSDNANLAFREYDLPAGVGGQAAVWSYNDDGGGNDRIARAEVTVDSAATGFTAGGWGWVTMIHEVGHALGLKHPGNYNAGGGGATGPYLTTFGYDDDRDESVMSYNAGNYATSANHPTTPMIFDIAAIQYYYGANTSYNSGNTTISMDAATNAHAVWDGGGTDTLDSSGVSNNAVLDLREGSDYFSNVGGNYLWIAFNANIENATSGTGNDVLYGNDLDNVLTSGAGNDTLQGGAGDDTLIGGAGSDQYIGSTGDADDTINDSDGLGSIILTGKTVAGSATDLGGGNYTLNITGTQFNLSLSGSTLTITINGNNNDSWTVLNFSDGDFGIDLGGGGGGGGNNAPTASNDSATTTENNAVTVTVLSNDSDPDNDTLSVTGINSAPSNGTAVVNGDGTITYTPNNAFTGNDSFSYDISDGNGGTATATVSITVNAGGGGGGGGGALDGDDDPNNIDGTPGADSIHGNGGDDVIDGTTGTDTLYGGDGDDYLGSDGDNSVLDGGDGNDKIDAAGNNDTISGGWGADRITARGDNVVLDSGMDGDYVISYGNNASLVGGGGSDYVNAKTGTDATISGGDGDDVLRAYMANAIVDGGDDDDDIYVYGATASIEGGLGNDYIRSRGDNTTIDGGAGNDEIQIVRGTTIDITGGSGDDTISGYSGDDTIDAGADNDEVDGKSGDDSITGGTGNDILKGSAGVDTLIGGAGDDIIMGGSGTDTITGDAGNDTIDGGKHNDTIDGGDGHDVIGGNIGDDSLVGNNGNDDLDGSRGADTLIGGAGNDKLSGGRGRGENDQLTGGLGNDVFVFVETAGTDTVTDFTDTEDLISFAGLGYNYGLVSANMVQNGGNVDITLASTTMTLTGVNLADLTADDFIF